MDQSAFFTRASHNDGVEMPLHTPDGKETDQYIIVKGSYSDSFRKQNTASLRAAMNKKLKESEREKMRLESIAALVGGWSFKQSCTKANVIKFLTEAPQIADAINIFAANNENFCEKKSEDLKTSQETTSN